MTVGQVTVLLDANICDKLEADEPVRALLASAVSAERLRVIAPPKVRDELLDSPFEGIPKWFPVESEIESVFVLNHAHLRPAGVVASMPSFRLTKSTPTAWRSSSNVTRRRAC